MIVKEVSQRVLFLTLNFKDTKIRAGSEREKTFLLFKRQDGDGDNIAESMALGDIKKCKCPD